MGMIRNLFHSYKFARASHHSAPLVEAALTIAVPDADKAYGTVSFHHETSSQFKSSTPLNIPKHSRTLHDSPIIDLHITYDRQTFRPHPSRFPQTTTVKQETIQPFDRNEEMYKLCGESPLRSCLLDRALQCSSIFSLDVTQQHRRM
jgi:hypothetical protein